MDTLEIAEAIVTDMAGMQKSLLSKHLTAENIPNKEVVFDSPMRDFLLKVKHRNLDLKGINKYLDAIGFGQSPYNPDDVVKLFRSFAGAGHVNNSGLRAFRKAKDAFKKLLESKVASNREYYVKFAPLSYVSEEQIVGAIPKLKSHAGFDAFIYPGIRRKEDFVKTGRTLMYYNEREERARKDGTFGSIVIPLHRTQAGDPWDKHNLDENGKFTAFKSRGVQPFGTMLTLAERKFSLPFTNFIAEEDWYAGGYNQSEMATIINRRRDRYSGWVSIDFSKFDSTLPRWLVLAAFDIVEHFFVCVENYCRPSVSFDKELFEIVKRDFVHTLIIAPNGEQIKSRHGVKSGSSFTQIIGTICNILLVSTYLMKNNFEFELVAMGDDNLIFLNVIPTEDLLEDMAKYFLNVFGVTISPQKSSFGCSETDHPEFLSRVWKRSGCYRDPLILVAKLLYPERFRDYVRLGFTPEEVILQYMAEFPLGMVEVVDSTKLDLIRSSSNYNASGITFAVTGSQRVQQIISATRGRKLEDLGSERIQGIAETYIRQ